MNEVRKSLGEELVRLRQERGIGVDELARATKIRASLLRALETGDFDALPPPVFVVGYLQAVARHLGADPEPLVQRYRRLTGEEGPVETGRADEVPEAVENHPRTFRSGWVLGGLAASALIAAGVLWGLRLTQPLPALKAPPVRPQEGVIEALPKGGAAMLETPGSPAEAPTSQAEPAPSGTQSPPQAAPKEAQTEEVKASEATTAPQEAGTSVGSPAPQPPAAAGDLVLTYSAPCWTEIWKGDERLVYRQVQAGERLSFKGNAFKATFGDASAVQVGFKGRPVHLPAGPGRMVKNLAIPRGAGGEGEAP